MSQDKIFASPQTVKDSLLSVRYLASQNLAAVVFLAYKLNKPLLIEGPAGVGKTELAKSISSAAGMPFIRLQCYEGLDEQHALYQWNYQKQLLYLQTLKLKDSNWQDIELSVFSEAFLLARPILQAFQSAEKTVLLIDEIDKADEEFESFLLEALSDFQMTIPELGTIRAQQMPLVFLTSNNVRDLSDGLRRRCIHLFIDYPSYEQELAILAAKLPELHPELAKAIIHLVQRVRKEKLKKPPSVAETLDWAKALDILGLTTKLDKNTVNDTLNLLLKYSQDQNIISNKLQEFI